MAFPKIGEGSKAKGDFVPFRAKKKGEVKGKVAAKGKEKMNAAKMAALKAKKK